METLEEMKKNVRETKIAEMMRGNFDSKKPDGSILTEEEQLAHLEKDCQKLSHILQNLESDIALVKAPHEMEHLRNDELLLRELGVHEV